MEKKNELFVITKCKDISKYVFTITDKSPKKYRYSVVTRLQNYTLEILELLYKANNTKIGGERLIIQNKAKEQLQLLDYFSQLAQEIEAITFSQYNYISKLVSETIVYLNKWIAKTK